MFSRPNGKQKGKTLETLSSGIIRNAMCLRLQRGWSTYLLIRQRHDQRVNQYDEEWKGCRTFRCSARNDKFRRRYQI